MYEYFLQFKASTNVESCQSHHMAMKEELDDLPGFEDWFARDPGEAIESDSLEGVQWENLSIKEEDTAMVEVRPPSELPTSSTSSSQLKPLKCWESFEKIAEHTLRHLRPCLQNVILSDARRIILLEASELGAKTRKRKSSSSSANNISQQVASLFQAPSDPVQNQ